MKRNIALLILTTLISLCCNGQSVKESFDYGWTFSHEEDGEGIPIDLPHDWDIYNQPKADAPMGNDGGYYPGGVGWYRKEFNGSRSSRSSRSSSGSRSSRSSRSSEGSRVQDETIKLHFEGVYQRCQVYLNNQLVATHAYGYTPFYVDITPYLVKGKNIVKVRVDNSLQPNCRWYTGSGIYRHVWLETYRKDCMDDPTQLFVRTQDIYGISADGSKADSATVRITYGNKFDEVRTYRDINLWSPSSPVLYDIKVGELTVRHGFRKISFSAADGFRLNNQPMLINGACVHHDDGVLGAMAFDAAEIRKVRLMKKAGFNLIRTSHNPTTRAFLDACDSLGMMVIDEMYDNWYTRKTRGDHHLELDSCYKEDFKALLTADRNHPSVICWSIGNEVMERKDIRVIQTARKFKNEVLRWDDTRPVTEALCSWDRDWEIFDPHAEVLDIVGYNYMMHKSESDHQRCPERIMWQTESYPRDAFRNWAHTAKYPYIIGDIVWTGLDYLGESGIGQFYYEGEPRGEHYSGKHFPFHGAYCGDVDITGWRKPISHYRSMLWNPDAEEKIYMAVREPDYYRNGKISETQWSVWPTWESWNWPGWEGKQIEVEVYTREPEVSLYLNGNLVETKKCDVSTEVKAVFCIPYQPGTLVAKAGKYKTSLLTSGEPYAIRLNEETCEEELAYVVAEVIDKDGNLVPDAETPVDVKVDGAGRLLAAASANFKDLEPMTSSHVTTYGGRALIVVRRDGKAGKIGITTVCGLTTKETRKIF